MTPRKDPDYEELVTVGVVARMFNVTPHTVGRWTRAGRLTTVRTPGGRRRYSLIEVRALLAEARTEKRP